ncbi:hypothetical protein [Magnetospirillum sp. UT-4]|uniref:hypothetical protein n=1 Tax=Magnetospirillum sp. UT-4 TaxID=2681467 RepID=UPI001383E893|nr:hypothetical protein [Magnetospirillum sp. UT-4]CAA7625068.1 conserved membrane hypothetical protein [Magnetospirillum sp. UT-4]
MTDRRASAIIVGEFREILVWPLRLDLDCRAGKGEVAAGHAATIGALDADRRWEPVQRLLGHLAPGGATTSEAEYKEFVYFHPFVRRFLYGEGDAAPMRLYRRLGLRAVELCLCNDVTGPFRVRLAVDRCNLYVLDSGNAVLALEVSAGSVRRGAVRPAMIETAAGTEEPMSLAHAQVILERFRRAYPPYWHEGGAGLAPRMVGWIGDGGERWHCMPTPADGTAHIECCGQPPVAGHWRDILAPLVFDGGTDGPRWLQVVDDRIPVIAFVAIDDAGTITEGDWVRLAMLDDAGNSPRPYGAGFPSAFDDAYCYDAFWDPAANDKTTRYLMSGHGFVAIGNGGDPFFANVVVDHVRRHYFQMGLIAHVQTAALLTLSYRLARAVERMDDREPAAEILADVITFTHRTWFPQVSGHVQAREIHARWRRHLGVDGLHDAVMREAQGLAAFLDGRAERKRADEAERLNRIAVTGLIPAVATGFLGMNILIKGKDEAKWIVADIPDVLLTLAGTAVVLGLLAWLVNKVWAWRGWKR